VARFGIFEADFQAGELRKSGVRIKLQDQPFQVLTMLLEHPGELVTREDIRKKLWPGDTFVDFDHGLNNAVNRLREALGDSADVPRFIETLPRRGYRFIAPTNGAVLGIAPGSSEEHEAEQTAVTGVSARPAETPKRASPQWLFWGALALASLTVLVVFKPRTTRVLPSSRSFVLPPEGTAFNLIGDAGGSVTLSPDGSKLAFVAVNVKGTPSVWVRPLAKLSAEPIDGTEGATFPFWSPNGNAIGFFADGKLKRANLEGGQVVTLCDAPFGRGGSWSGEVIIFAPTSHSAIYKVSDSGGVPVALTTVDNSIHTTHRWPRFLPDGKHFIYLAASHLREASRNGVYLGSVGGKEDKLIMLADADATYASGYLFFLRKNALLAQPFDPVTGELRGEIRPTVEKVLYDPSIWKIVFDASENGAMVYQLGEKVRGTQFKWFDRTGKQLSVLDDSNFKFELRLSRDGRKLVTGRRALRGSYSDLVVYDLVRDSQAQITFNASDNGSPIWAHDDTRILFSGKRQHYSLYQTDPTGRGQEQLILDTGSDTWPLDLSSDGRYLLYGQGLNIGRARSQLWIYAMDGKGPPFPLLGSRAVETDGQFSPDGRWVAYTSNESGTDEIYVVPFHGRPISPSDTGVSGKWQLSISGGRWPRWRRDGRELFYMALDNRLMVVPVSSSSSKFQIGKTLALFQANPAFYSFPFDVSPNGNRFIVNTAAPETTAPITLVENWPSDFAK
jgi:DNA-binding winged helix-turn-helix (wHTH) protein/Tol biopolymer transport system component